MCGITGLLLKRNGQQLASTIAAMTDRLRHRGPDGEGFLLAGTNEVSPRHNNGPEARYHEQIPELPWLPEKPLSGTGDFSMAFGHRRLSIIDLSPAGHQPMCDAEQKVWLTFNGEIYNYIELREELLAKGFRFFSKTDTEVVLNAWRAWGENCVHRFNGMWAFCIYDATRNILFASRDRLGVKPFYYVDNNDLFAFASEQKGLIEVLPGQIRWRKEALKSYLLDAALERNEENFFEGVRELSPGHSLTYDISEQRISTRQYFHLSEVVNHRKNSLNDDQLITQIRDLVVQAVKLRMRSDVEVGACLSGGVDSTVIASLMRDETNRPVKCFTAVFPGELFDESKYAEIAARNSGAQWHTTAPEPDEFMRVTDELVYALDAPIWDTSTFAQFSVMKLAAQHNIKVVLDGQGADELFAGYHHHFIAKWQGLIRRGKIAEAIRDINGSRKTFASPFVFFLKQQAKRMMPFASNERFFEPEFLRGESRSETKYCADVNEQLIDDIYRTRLKSFLRCEDRCGMWHSVESRTPFSDDTGLLELMFSFDGSRKIQNGVSKYLLREAMRHKLPPEIYTRYDKKGFESPMQKWVRRYRAEMISEVRSAGFSFLRNDALAKLSADRANHNRLLFRLFIAARWQSVFGKRAVLHSTR